MPRKNDNCGTCYNRQKFPGKYKIPEFIQDRRPQSYKIEAARFSGDCQKILIYGHWVEFLFLICFPANICPPLKGGSSNSFLMHQKLIVQSIKWLNPDWDLCIFFIFGKRNFYAYTWNQSNFERQSRKSVFFLRRLQRFSIREIYCRLTEV